MVTALGICFAMLCSVVVSATASAEEFEERDVLVTASAQEFEEPGGYGQPQWAERSRASVTTKLYVLSPFEFYAGIVSESNFPQNGKSFHRVTQEIELGLPHRFEIGIENDVGISGKDVEEERVGFAGRYAFGAWGAIPLNPTISGEYNFSVGRNRTRPSAARRSDTLESSADSYELRLLLGQEFFPRIQWASNFFFGQEINALRNRELGFTQSVTYTILPDRLELGWEMRYKHEKDKRSASRSEDQLVIGPSINWKPNRHIVVSLAPLLGCTSDSPQLATFFTASIELGGGESAPRARIAKHE